MEGRLTQPVPRRFSVRPWGLLLFLLVFAEAALGVVSAGAELAGVTALLVAHLTLGAVVIGLSGWVFLQALRVPSRTALFATGFTVVALGCTGITGAIFLATGFPGGARVDQALAIVSLGGTILMVVFGPTAPAVDV